MNTRRSQLLGLFSMATVGGHAQMLTFTPNLSIPDGEASGVYSAGNVSTSIASLQSVRVSVSITGVGGGMNNGDLYVTLAHEASPNVVDSFVVLLNRPGRTAADDQGYYDNGLNVVFDARSVGYDIHNYRRHVPTLNGGLDSTRLGGALTGTWEPDGRNVSADLVTDATPRTTSLANFSGVNPNGRWVLFVADLAPDSAGHAQLNSWSLELVPGVVPEVGGMTCAVGLGLLGVGLWRRRHNGLA